MPVDAAQLSGFSAFFKDGVAAPAAAMLLVANIAQWFAGRRDRAAADARTERLVATHREELARLHAQKDTQHERILITSERLISVMAMLEKRTTRRAPGGEGHG